MDANVMCNVTGHEEVKPVIYSPKKCTFCKKRCLFRLRKMVKCTACKGVMHRKCLAAANGSAAGRRVGEVAAVRNCTVAAAPPVTNVHRLERVPTERADGCGEWAPRLPVTWILTAASGVTMHDALCTWLAVGAHAQENADREITANGPGGHGHAVPAGPGGDGHAVPAGPGGDGHAIPAGPGGDGHAVPAGPVAVTRRTVWTWSMTAGDGLLVSVFFPLPPQATEATEARWSMEAIWARRSEQVYADADVDVDGCDADEKLLAVREFAGDSSRITAFDCIKMILRENNNTVRERHCNIVKVEPTLFTVKSKLTKTDYLKLCEPWEFKKIRRNECKRNVYSLTVNNSRFKDKII